MTVKELMIHLSHCEPNDEIRMIYNGPDTTAYLPIKTVVFNGDFLFLDSEEYEPVEDEEIKTVIVDEMSLGKTIQSLNKLSELPPPNFPKLRLIKGES